MSLPVPPRRPTRPSGAWRAAAGRQVEGSLGRRRRTDLAMRALLWTAGGLTALPLVLILGYLAWRGVAGLSPTLFTRLPAPVGVPGGGIGNAFVGSLVLTGMAAAIGVPVGLLAGAHLADRPDTRTSALVRYVADVLNGTPSIVLGIAAWGIVVRPMQRFSAFAGAVALAAILAPLVARTTEQMLRMVPSELRQAALALGFTEWRTAVRVAWPAAGPGIVTGVLVALGRVAGETAPLLFTAFGNPYWSASPAAPIAAVPLQVYTYALSPYDAWRSQAWAGALVLVSAVGLLTLLGRRAASRRAGRGT